MNEALDKAISKVQKLLALAASTNSEHELHAATAAADKIMQEYRISQAMLESAGEIKVENLVKKTIHSGGRRTSWRESIIRALCNHYSCAWYMYHKQNVIGNNVERLMQYNITGYESDVHIVDYLFKYLSGEGERLCKLNNKGFGLGWAKSWLEGFGSGVASQFQDIDSERRKQMEAADSIMKALGQNNSTQTALVLLDQRIVQATKYAEEVGKFRTYKRGELKGKPKLARGIYGAQSDLSAKADGFDKGQKVSIRKGIGEIQEVKKLK